MTVVFSDDFNRANGDVGSNYDQLEGDVAEVSSNRLLLFNSGTKANQIRTNSNAHAALADVALSIQRVGVGSVGFFLNVRDTGTGGSRSLYTCDFASPDVVELGRIVNDSYTFLQSWSADHEDGDVLTLEASGTGASVTLTPKINGVAVGTPYVDSSGSRITSPGQVGVGAFFNGSITFDNLQVESLSAGGGTAVPVFRHHYMTMKRH